MLLAKSELKNSDFLQRGRIRYSAGIFCLGHALELAYKLLLLKDRGDYPKGHSFDRLFGRMNKEDKDAICQIVRDAGWDSCDPFHDFMANDIRFTDRKYYDFLSPLDHWTHDRSGQNLDHKLWPQVVLLCENLHRYAASTIWIDPNPAIGPVKEPWLATDRLMCAAQGCARTPRRTCSAASTASPSRRVSQPPVSPDHWAHGARQPCFRVDGARRLYHRDDACRQLENRSHGRSLQRGAIPE